MSHARTGFFYYRYTYHCTWMNPTSKTSGTEDSFHSAVYSRGKKDHAAQNAWFKNRAMPAVTADILKWYTTVDRNNLGRNYERFSQVNIKQLDFDFYEKLPQHTEGPRKGQPFGKEI